MWFVLVDAETGAPRSSTISMKDATRVYGWTNDYAQLDLARAESIGLRPVYDSGHRPNCLVTQKLVDMHPIYEDGMYLRNQKAVGRDYNSVEDMQIFDKLVSHGHGINTKLEQSMLKHNPSSAIYKQCQQTISDITQAITRIEEHVASKGTLHRLSLNFPHVDSNLL
jgi:hypothetical protein